MISGEQHLKELETSLKAIVGKLREELGQIRGSRPSIDLVEGITVIYFDQPCAINTLGSLSVVPPRSIRISVWDKNAVGPIMKAIESAHAGLSVSNSGNDVIATLSPLISERREELTRLVKKTAEAFRIQIRARRDESIKRIKEAENKKELNEDAVFKLKEKMQSRVDETNKQVEAAVEGKIKELGE